MESNCCVVQFKTSRNLSSGCIIYPYIKTWEIWICDSLYIPKHLLFQNLCSSCMLCNSSNVSAFSEEWTG